MNNMMYSDEMILPNGCSTIDSDEMSYIDGGVSRIYVANKAVTYLKGKVNACTNVMKGSIVIGALTAETIIGAAVGGVAAAYWGQWAVEYNTALKDVNKEIKNAGYSSWLVGVTETTQSGWLSIDLDLNH